MNRVCTHTQPQLRSSNAAMFQSPAGDGPLRFYTRMRYNIVGESMADKARVPHALLNPASEPLYSSVARIASDVIASSYTIEHDVRSALIALDEQTRIRLLGDAFSAFYVSWPIVRRSKLDNPVVEALRRTLSYLVQTPEFQRIQAMTRYSVGRSLVYGARLAINVLRALAVRNIVGYLGVSRRVSERSVDAAARSAASSTRHDLKDGMLQQLASEVEELYQLLKQQEQGGKPCGCRGLGAAAATNASSANVATVAVATGFSGDEHGNEAVVVGTGKGGREAGKAPGALETAARIATLAVTDPSLMRIIIMGGRIEAKFRFMRSQRRESRRGTVDGYSITANPAKALPREHALPTELWLAKLANGRWLTKRRVEEKLGMLIMAIDKSGSMAGEKTVWARSIAYALTKLAMKRRQPVALLFFDFDVWGPYTDPRQIIEALLTVESSGGTSINNALRSALRLLDQHRDKTNTVVLITDGEDTVTVTPAELKRRSARLVAVMVHGDNKTLQELAKASGGQYLQAKLNEDGALEVVDAAL